MNAHELFEELTKLSVVELEQRLRQLQGELEATKALLKIARARQKGKKKAAAANGHTRKLLSEPAEFGA